MALTGRRSWPAGWRSWRRSASLPLLVFGDHPVRRRQRRVRRGHQRRRAGRRDVEPAGAADPAPRRIQRRRRASVRSAPVRSSEADCRSRLVYPVLAVCLVAVAVLAATRRVAARRDSEGRSRAAIALAMLPLAGLAGLAFLAEGSMETWSAIYLRDVLGAAAFVGALGPGAFHAAMLVGRLIGAGVAGSLGAPRHAARVGHDDRRRAWPWRCSCRSPAVAIVGHGGRGARRLVRGAGGREPRRAPRRIGTPAAPPRTS